MRVCAQTHLSHLYPQPPATPHPTSAITNTRPPMTAVYFPCRQYSTLSLLCGGPVCWRPEWGWLCGVQPSNGSSSCGNGSALCSGHRPTASRVTLHPTRQRSLWLQSCQQARRVRIAGRWQPNCAVCGSVGRQAGWQAGRHVLTASFWWCDCCVAAALDCTTPPPTHPPPCCFSTASCAPTDLPPSCCSYVFLSPPPLFPSPAACVWYGVVCVCVFSVRSPCALTADLHPPTTLSCVCLSAGIAPVSSSSQVLAPCSHVDSCECRMYYYTTV